MLKNNILTIKQFLAISPLNKVKPLYYAIKDCLEQSTTVGSDETGASVDGKKTMDVGLAKFTNDL